MNSYIRQSTVFLIQLLGIALLFQTFCSGFQATTISPTTRNWNVIENTQQRTSPRHSTAAATRIRSSQDGNDPSSHSAEHTITVHYEDRSCDISVRSDETILSALERNQLSLENLGLPNAAIPSDCRRGNCLTCTGTHASVSSRQASGRAVVSDGDGLSPHISQTIQDKGYILTCSTRVVGEGLQLNLGENHKVWKDIYQDRLEKEPTQDVKWAAMARVKRQSDERNKAQWEKQLEDLVQKDKDTGGVDSQG